MDECIFCKIVNKQIPKKIEKETDEIVVFKDVNPRAPIHLLLVPRKHYQDITEADGQVWSKIREVALQIAKEKNLKGFRLVHNAGDAAAVAHMHVHFLAEVSKDREI
ncbi:MAG: Histidine triad (HIT) family protein [Candidatus Curtissbacteria bacterium GW2011_GWC1_44_33]|uniref:Histidine triad (HIT) family protein n=1 Tax=Candidatus Curtissbacteria bacterium GW2011_GWC1_44_33 TaxID=1618413 RepID=A0A0G1J3W7_9BACT|nr:MAG: Histidine triad (HIT) family protein [Candidatus Curtissbacteria bacterium GW2011_GWC1_44_33]